MQDLIFKYASVYVNSPSNVEASINLLRSISFPDSQLFYPAQFGYLTTRAEIETDVRGFAGAVNTASVWIPANGWILDKEVKFGVVGSNNKKSCYYHCGTEIQFRQTVKTGANLSTAVNDFWSFFIDNDAAKFFQIKEWLDGRVGRIQLRRTILGQEILILDTSNTNVIPF